MAENPTEETKVKQVTFQSSVEKKSPKKCRVRIKGLLKEIREQMEFYFGDSNLSKDRFMKQKMEEDSEGYLPLSMFFQFNKIKEKTKDIEILAKAVQLSEILKLSEDRSKVKRSTPIKFLSEDDVDERTVYVDGFFKHTSHVWLRKHFSTCGKVTYVSLPRYKSTKDIKGFAFIEFETPAEAARAVKKLNQVKEKQNLSEKVGTSVKTSTNLKYLRKRATKEGLDVDELEASKDVTTTDQEQQTPKEGAKSKSKKKKKKRRSTLVAQGEEDMQVIDSTAESAGSAKEDSSAVDSKNTDETKVKKSKKSKKKKKHATQSTEESMIEVFKESDVSGTEEKATKPESAPETKAKEVKEQGKSTSDAPLEKKKKGKATGTEESSESEDQRKNSRKRQRTEEEKKEDAEISEPSKRKKKKREDGSQQEEGKGLDDKEGAGKVKAKTDSSKTSSASKDKMENVTKDDLVSAPQASVDGSAGQKDSKKKGKKEGADSAQEKDAKGKKMAKGRRGSERQSDSGLLPQEGRKRKRRNSEGRADPDRKKKRLEVEGSSAQGDAAANPEGEEGEQGTGKKKRRRNRQARNLRLLQEKAMKQPKLKVMSKKQWMELKSEYLNLQKTNMHKLKEQLQEVALKNDLNNRQKSLKREQGGSGGRAVPEFEPNVVLEVKSDIGICHKTFKGEEFPLIDIVYVDIKEGSTHGYVRCRNAENAKKLLKNRRKGYTFTLVQGEAEQAYWNKLVLDREAKLANNIRTKKRGMKKLLDRAQNPLVDGYNRQHLFFNDDENDTNANGTPANTSGENALSRKSTPGQAALAAQYPHLVGAGLTPSPLYDSLPSAPAQYTPHNSSGVTPVREPNSAKYYPNYPPFYSPADKSYSPTMPSRYSPSSPAKSSRQAEDSGMGQYLPQSPRQSPASTPHD